MDVRTLMGNHVKATNANAKLLYGMNIGMEKAKLTVEQQDYWTKNSIFIVQAPCEGGKLGYAFITDHSNNKGKLINLAPTIKLRSQDDTQ